MTTELAVQADANGQLPDAAVGVRGVIETMDALKAIRTFIAREFIDKVDYGLVPGAAKKSLWQAGAQKACMYFNCYPKFRIRPAELGNGHVEYVITTTLISRATREEIGSGVGSCSTMEKKYRYRGSGRVCPNCGAMAIKKSKFKPGFYCHDKSGGCGTQYQPNDKSITEQEEKPAENPDIADVRNTVLKMAKKRSQVDAALGLGCLSELFSQDIDDIYDLETIVGEVAPEGPPVAQNNSGHGRGSYASPEQTKAYEDALAGFLAKKNADWSDSWDEKALNFLGPKDVGELLSPWQANGHLVKWAVESGKLDGSIVPEDVKASQKAKYVAVVYHRSKADQKALGQEMERYAAEQWSRRREALYGKHPELRPPADDLTDADLDELEEAGSNG